MKICGIYKITSPNKKVYIGQSVNIIKRWRDYKYVKNNRQFRLYNSFTKYGIDKHKFEILCQCDKSELNNLEKYYIELFQCFNSNNGLNLKTGGESNTVYSNESKKKMSESQKRRFINTLHPQVGKHLSDHHKKLISESWKHRTVSDETKKKISESNKRLGRKVIHIGNHTEETKIKIGNANRGRTSFRKGKKLSEEHKQHMRDTWALKKLKRSA